MDAMERHYCEIYLCEMSAGACATRYMKARTRKKESLWVQINDANCERCKEGKRIFNALGMKKISAYRGSVNRVKHAAWKQMEDERMAHEMTRMVG